VSRDRFFKFIYPWLPVFVFVLFIGAASNFGRIIFSETPEITGSNAETISNETDGSWDFGSANIVIAGDVDLGDLTGLQYFGVGLTVDTILNSNIEFTSRSDHSVIFVSWVDSNDGDALDTLALSAHVWAAGSCLVATSDTMTAGGDTFWYGYAIFQ